MNQPLLRFVHSAYVRSRRRGHSLLSRFPSVDRAIGDPLRALTRTWESKIVRRAVPNPLRVDKHLISHRPEDAALISRLRCQAYEREVYQRLLDTLHAGMTVVDAGAHIGWYTLLTARLVGPTGSVYAFEAVPSTVETLQRNIAQNHYTNIEVVPLAVSNTSGSFHVFIDKLFSSSASLFPIDDQMQAIEIQATTLDQVFRGKGWPPVHLVKLDIEGAEKLALDGMQELSRRNPLLKAIVEVNLRKFTVEELLDALAGCGFSRYYALELRKPCIIPQDISQLVSASRSITVNLFCEKASGSI